MLRDLLGLTTAQAAEQLRSGSADTQAAARFLLQRLRDKDHRALVRYLTDENALDTLRAPFNDYRTQETGALARLLQASAAALPLANLIAALFIVQSVAAGEPLRLPFAAPTQPAKALDADDHNIAHDDDAWLFAQVAELTDEKHTVCVSEWAEQKRYLPAQVTSMPGFYSYEVTPPLREIADCMSIDSPVREVDFMKAAQIGATVGVLENTIGYCIDHVQSAPIMLLTADAELAKLRVDSYVTPMLQHSDLAHLIQSADESNKRKTGKTDKRIEWVGGGFLVPFGARNADKLRSISIQYLLEDECDAYPDIIGKDGDPQKLAEARTKAYHPTRKIMRVSTPLIAGRSRIARGFERGDQRYWFVPCKKCNTYQPLRFQGKNEQTGEAFGLVWTTNEDGVLDPDSVRYLCAHCGHPHRNADKAWLLPRGEWRATATARDPEHRSYHLSALYSPIGMYDWSAIVRDWLDAWDTERNTPKSVGALQEFYNNVLGEPFEVIGSKVRFASVSAHRRLAYRSGEVPNDFALQHCGGPVLFLTCQVDVHKSNLAVAVMAWTEDARCFVVQYERFEAEDCADIRSPVWERLRELIEERQFGRYRILLTLIDAGFANDTVSTFCSDYVQGVVPILGRERPAKNQTIREFAPFKTQAGTVGYRILVDHYKDRMASVLRREWHEASGLQPRYHFNAPIDLTDKQLTELTVETRREATNERGEVTHVWHRKGNARNELWDLLGYGYAGVEIVAWLICTQEFDLETVDWPQFWAFAADPEQDERFGRLAQV